jgi:hypothetical protein
MVKPDPNARTGPRLAVVMVFFIVAFVIADAVSGVAMWRMPKPSDPNVRVLCSRAPKEKEKKRKEKKKRKERVGHCQSSPPPSFHSPRRIL